MDERRSDLLVYGKWVNPYTNKEEDLDIWLPNECIDRNIQSYFKNAFDIDIADKNKFEEFLDILGKSISSLSDFPDFINICLEDYYKTPFYDEDKKDALADYELTNNLGEYAEADDYVE